MKSAGDMNLGVVDVGKERGTLVGRDVGLARQVVFLDGLTGTGKTMMSPILATLDRMEAPRIEHIYEHVCVLHSLGRIEDDAADTLLSLYIDLACYNSMIARESNFRWKDLSGVLSNQGLRYVRRLFLPDGDAVTRRIAAERPILPILSHQAFSVMGPLFRILGSRLTVVEMVRHPLYLIEHWYSYIDSYGTSDRDFTISVLGKHGRLPWFAAGWEDRYESGSRMDRVIYAIDRLMRAGEESYRKRSETERERVLVIPFETFVSDPRPHLDRIANLLETRTTQATVRALRRGKVPRRITTDGPDKAIYRRYAWQPPDSDTSEDRELGRRWDRAASEASAPALEILERLSEDYETEHLGGRMEWERKR